MELVCATESFPRSVNYWTKLSGTGISSGSARNSGPNPSTAQEVIVNGDRYEIREQYRSQYSGQISLRIRRFETADAGSYMCISSNAFGKANKTIRVYGKSQTGMGSHKTILKFGAKLLALECDQD